MCDRLCAELDAMSRVMPLPSPTVAFCRPGSKWKTMKYCIVSSLCEPIAAVVFGMFFNNYLTRYLMSALNAGGEFWVCLVSHGLPLHACVALPCLALP